jgi:pimeloyl-ACP methyl ester carboxylesterase
VFGTERERWEPQMSSFPPQYRLTTRRTACLAPLACVAVALVPGAAIGAHGASAARADGPKLTACAGGLGALGARCGSIGVPLDRTSPGAGTTRIVFALIPRRDTSRPSLGTVVLSSGPIIAAGVEYAQGLAPLRSRRDVLFVDQRGTGRSGVLACRALRGAVPALSSREQLLSLIGKCGRQLGSRMGLYGTAAAADDIDAVRAALGLERLDLWGSSYGTYLMTVYAARHPAHVRSLVLHGAYPIDFDPWALDRLAAARRSISLVCARTHDCRGATVLRDLARLATRLRSHPLSFTVPVAGRSIRVRLDESALAGVVWGAGNVAGFGRIPAAAASAVAGDLAQMRRLVELTVQPIDEGFGQAFAQQCHEYPRVFSYGDTPRVRRAAYVGARAAIGSTAFAPFSPEAWTATQLEAVDSCLDWPNDVAAARPFPAGTLMPDVPVLALSGDLDTNTPAASGREAARRFPQAVFVEIPNVGHTPEASPCGVAVALRFVATLTVNKLACAGTGAPPPVAARAPRVAAELPLVGGGGTPVQRRALALVVATAADMKDQSQTLRTWSAANALRGGRYVAAKGGVQLDSVRVVRDATVSGVLVPTDSGDVTGALRLSGRGVADGRLRVSLRANGHGRATGDLHGTPVDLTFRV